MTATTPIIETITDDGLGLCQLCGDPLARGEQVSRTLGGLQHAECAEDQGGGTYHEPVRPVVHTGSVTCSTPH